MKDEGDWVEAARVEDVPPGHGYQTDLVIAGEEVGLFNIDGEFFAIGECPHEQGPICEGRLVGHRVVCPWHSASFDLRTGACLEGPVACRVAGDVTVGSAAETPMLDPCRVFPVKVEEGIIYVRGG